MYIPGKRWQCYLSTPNVSQLFSGWTWKPSGCYSHMVCTTMGSAHRVHILLIYLFEYLNDNRQQWYLTWAVKLPRTDAAFLFPGDGTSANYHWQWAGRGKLQCIFIKPLPTRLKLVHLFDSINCFLYKRCFLRVLWAKFKERSIMGGAHPIIPETHPDLQAQPV